MSTTYLRGPEAGLLAKPRPGPQPAASPAVRARGLIEAAFVPLLFLGASLLFRARNGESLAPVFVIRAGLCALPRTPARRRGEHEHHLSARSGGRPAGKAAPGAATRGLAGRPGARPDRGGLRAAAVPGRLPAVPSSEWRVPGSCFRDKGRALRPSQDAGPPARRA